MLDAFIPTQGVSMKRILSSKLAWVLAVFATLALLLARIEGLVSERSARQTEAVRSVQQASAAHQHLIGPVLERACTERWEAVRGEGRERTTVTESRAQVQRWTAEQLVATTRLAMEPRYRGLYKVNAYVSRWTLQAQWPQGLPAAPAPMHANGQVQCDAPRLWIALHDVRGVRQARLMVDGQPLAVSGGTGHPAYTQGLQAHWSAAHPGTPIRLDAELELVGSSELALVPAAADVQWTLTADWPHPSFGGQFLPVERTVRDTGFEATWRVSQLASGASTAVLQDTPVCGLDGESGRGCLDTLAVALIDPVNPYLMSDRAVRYGLLFVALAFTGLGLCELLSRRGRPVHPVQYALVGLALATFFLLLLSLSEHLPFALAYAVSGLACLGVMSGYVSTVLGGWRGGVAFAGASGFTLGLLYWLLMREQTALAIGSVAALAVLAAVMWLTRRIDWFALGRPAEPAA